MREIVILVIGQTPIEEQWEKSIREIAGEAVLATIHDAGVERVDGIFIGNMLSGILSRQEHLGAMLVDWLGIKNAEGFKLEAACASGAAAIRTAIMAVASGELDTAVAVGVEKMSETKGTETTAALATAADADYEHSMGLSFVALNALIMQRYMHEYHWQHSDFAQFSINAHNNALHNQYARLHEKITQADYEKARMIATPNNLLDASPIGDGAAAVIIHHEITARVDRLALADHRLPPARPEIGGRGSGVGRRRQGPVNSNTALSRAALSVPHVS